MTAELHPAEGARYLFEREDGATEDSAVYEAAIFTPQARFDYRVTVSSDGSYAASPRGEAASAELDKRLGNFARQIARAAKGKKEDGLPPWPARVLRWRGPGRG